MWLGWERWWSSLKLLDHLTPVWWFTLLNKVNHVIHPVFLASLHCTNPHLPQLQEVLGLLLQWPHLVLESFQPTSSLRIDPVAKVRVLSAPFPLFYSISIWVSKWPSVQGSARQLPVSWDCCLRMSMLLGRAMEGHWEKTLLDAK